MNRHNDSSVPFFLYVIFALVFFWLAGCSPKGSYKVLRFFFDGVNDSMQMEAPYTIPVTSGRDSVSQFRVPAEPVPSEFIYHEPYGSQKCSLCHDKAARSRLLKAVPELCVRCHTDFTSSFAYLHNPVKNGKCLLCHDHHLSLNPKLLKQPASGLCQTCHSPDELSSIEEHSRKDGCISCHDPHGGNDSRLLKH